MSQETVEIVRRCVEDVELFWSLLAEDVVWDLRQFPRVDLSPMYVGREAVIAGSRHYWGTWDDYRLDAEEVIDCGSCLVVAVREQGRGRGSGIPVERRWAQVWTFQQGLIVRWELYPDRASALEAAGLPE